MGLADKPSLCIWSSSSFLVVLLVIAGLILIVDVRSMRLWTKRVDINKNWPTATVSPDQLHASVAEAPLGSSKLRREPLLHQDHNDTKLETQVKPGRTDTNSAAFTTKEDKRETVVKPGRTDCNSAAFTTKEDNKNTKLGKIEGSLARARASIKAAAKVPNLASVHDDPDYVPGGPIYRNANGFHRSYLEMERLLKIYVYEEGDAPIFHDGPCKSIYSTEGRFIHELEKGKLYTTADPGQALVYFLPFSVVRMVQYLYEPNSHNTDAIKRTVVDYVNLVANKYSYWNRSLGADHFMLSCHDWGPQASSYVPLLFNNAIRVLCNANASEGFNPSKDVSFPEIHLRTGEIEGLVGGLSPSRRPILAFFAGRLHGHIRYLLLEQWKEKDEDVLVYDQLPVGVSYDWMLKRSRFCLCPSGYEVASPRIVEAIYAECVPVLISDSYVPPFSDVLNWNSFSVQVEVKDIPNIKTILSGISQRQYLRLQRRVKQVQRHFLLRGPPKRYDVFHMTLHSIWLRRLNIQVTD